MSITDELRHFANEWDWLDYRADESARRLRAIADRIDAEHQKAIHELNGLAEASVLLPKDADGVPIHIGDVMEACYDYQLSSTPEVRAMRYGEGGWEVYDRLGDRYHPSSLRHHHAQTVEDVLREFALAVCKDDALTIREGVVEEFAKRLTLAEGEDA